LVANQFLKFLPLIITQGGPHLFRNTFHQGAELPFRFLLAQFGFPAATDFFQQLTVDFLQRGNLALTQVEGIANLLVVEISIPEDCRMSSFKRLICDSSSVLASKSIIPSKLAFSIA